MEVGVRPSRDYHIGRVKRKLATGTYQTEPVACFCGSTSAQLVTDKDRYGFEHPMWMCKACGILYANPRMTEATYAEFYAQEYRAIYDTPEDTLAHQQARGEQRSMALRDYLQEEYQVRPAVVFDIGCNAGAWLQTFQEAGAEVHGVDYGPERVALGQSNGLPIEVGSIEALEVLGMQADLIIMNHVLEHATNLEETLRRVRGLLRDDGMLYVALPGLFLAELDGLFQNAHPWQFTAETLTYVMECCGFEEVRADQSITSLWKKAEVAREKTHLPLPSIVRDIANHLFRRGTRFIPRVRCFNKFSQASRRDSIASAVARRLPKIQGLIDRHTGKPAIVIGGGPSVDGYVEQIQSLHAAGAVLICIERMYPWCLAHGLIPHYVVTQDASDDVLEAFETLTPGSTFLIAAQCQPAVFDRLQGQPCYYFHTSSYTSGDIPQEELRGPGDEGMTINAGGSVTLCSLSLSMLMGMSSIHLFGFDCHVTAGNYARGIAGVGEQADLIPIKIDGRAFRTTLAYLAFAQQFFEFKEIGKSLGLLDTITVYGDSLVVAMSTEPIGA
jgi:2-polyprenyl-3-methyl-5-hydroxy-6-metoxy-1,4-benzoquinol methylase